MAETLHIAYSFQCNLACDHCIFRCGPGLDQALGVEAAEAVIGQARGAGIRRIVFTGGEPLLHYPVIQRLVRSAVTSGLECAVITNASWAGCPARTRKILRSLKQAGLSSITLSTDRYHARRVPVAHVIRALELGREAGLRVAVKIARLAHDPIAWGLYRAVASHSQATLVQEISPLGRAWGLRRAVPASTLPCLRHNGCRTPAVLLPDGSLLACCNLPARDLEPTDFPFILGNTHENSLRALLARHREDPVLALLRRFGPVQLLERLGRGYPGLRALGYQTFHDGCDLCFHILSSRPVRQGRAHTVRPWLAEPLTATPPVPRSCDPGRSPTTAPVVVGAAGGTGRAYRVSREAP